MALGSLLTAALCIVAEADGLVLGRPRGALAGLPRVLGRVVLVFSGALLASFLATLALLGVSGRCRGYIGCPLAIEGQRRDKVSLLYRGVLPGLLEGLAKLVALLGDQLVGELPDSRIACSYPSTSVHGGIIAPAASADRRP